MLRIRFSGEDLGRTSLVEGPLPLWETVLSLHRLQRGDGGLLIRQWRRQARQSLPPDWPLLATLVPPKGYFADFLTPPIACRDVREDIERVTDTPRAVVRRDLELLAPPRGTTPFAGALWRGDAGAHRHLGQALTTYHRAVVAPFWSHIEEQVVHDRARRASLMLSGGVERLLDALPPALRWRPPVLEVDYPVDQELVLAGRGLMLVPSFFCLNTGVTLLHNDHTPVLVYPVEHRPVAGSGNAGGAGTPDARRISLAALLGHSRAAVLQALEQTSTTSELARRVGVLPSSASQHVTVLRNTGLVRTRRSGRSALHSLTLMGAALAHRGYINPFEFTPKR